jgi:hypothetical protein
MLRQPLIGWISRFCPIKNSSSFPCKKTHTNTHTKKKWGDENEREDRAFDHFSTYADTQL